MRTSSRRKSIRIAHQVGKTIGSAVDVTTDLATDLMGIPRLRKPNIGAPPGIDSSQLKTLPSTDELVHITCTDYAPEKVQVQTVEDLEDFVVHHRPDWSVVRWVNVDGLTNMTVIQALAEKYDLHPLAIEDVLHIPQRPKVDVYGEGPSGESQTPARLFIIARMLELNDHKLCREQISIFVGHRTVITFQESKGDVWDPIRARIQKPGSQLRLNGAGFLAYSLLDAIIDHCFPILEYYGDRLEELEEIVYDKPTPAVVHQIHQLRRELLLIRRDIWPMREVIHTLQREPHECMSDTTRTYLRDVYDHTVQIIDLIETYREMGTGLTEAYMSSLSIRMNETMKVLTIIGTIFIPLTFLAGVYGMNFDYMPEINWLRAYPWSYPIGFWVICAAISIALVVWFKRRGWI
ncbi:MAG: magnesium/cobalt transporter CorA [Phycisphaeraceae bacterium]|nr:magnesium/cobalt transporter CorA [Phycisphaeraceae bacterium]